MYYKPPLLDSKLSSLARTLNPPPPLHPLRAYMPFKPLYGILEAAVTQGANQSWWRENGKTTTLVDWVRWYEWVPSRG